MSVLHVEDLTVDFRLEEGRLRAVDGVSFTVEEGETLGLLGESGSGKTVTALAVVRLLDPQAEVVRGRLLFRGEDLLRKSPEEMRRLRGAHISMILQEPMTALNPAFTVGDQVAEIFRAHLPVDRREAKREAVLALERARLPRAIETYGRYPHELSGGMRQRVVIAMALALRPDLVIADEPTTALDVTIQAQILALLGELQREMKMALILISHDLEVVAQVCDRIAVMYAGKLMEMTRAKALFTRPAHPYSEGLLRSIPRRGEPLVTIPGTLPDLSAVPPGCVFHPRCPRARERCVTDVPALRPMPGPDEVVAACHFPLTEPVPERVA